MLKRFLFRSHLNEGEKIKYIVHTHFIRMAKAMIINFFFGFFLPGLGFLIAPAAFYFWVVIFIIFLAKTIHDYLDWFYDAWIVTNLGVIDTEWKGVFNRSSSKVEYSSIEGVSIEIPGFWATVLGFGNLKLETASQSPIELEMGMRPSRAESIILKYRERYMHERNLSDESILRDILSSMVSRHVKNYGLNSERS